MGLLWWTCTAGMCKASLFMGHLKYYCMLNRQKYTHQTHGSDGNHGSDVGISVRMLCFLFYRLVVCFNLYLFLCIFYSYFMFVKSASLMGWNQVLFCQHLEEINCLYSRAWMCWLNICNHTCGLQRDLIVLLRRFVNFCDVMTNVDSSGCGILMA